ncbi:ABC transporter substrate-binding protein [Methylobrevis pamukkalensis]|uniref:Glycine betaine transporter periplasmic subunit n=1 Tax=Methylobrevis pamukkalensis TaxID=1439726 RepID=A0A1E3H7I9_9HYPH|nr:ABC transporter substrate-binding protein [Methylobrevis pamukkalensis]ODN72297.1 glycine betaine transporter periplasmic subunit [Methylobrevis pamukkalensis]
MKTVIAGAAVAAAMLAAPGALAADCGRVTIANMNWPSAEVLAWIDSLILTEGYGCAAELVVGDTQPTLTSMIEKGEPDVAPEGWINSYREALDTAVAEGRLFYAVSTLSDGAAEGFWIPKYVAEAHPEIRSIPDALARPELFPAPEDPGKGAVYNCPTGWGCETNVGNLFRAYDGEDKGFVLVDTGSAAGLDGSIARAFERKEPWLGYYWSPTAILGKYEMVRLDPGEGVTFDKAEWDRCTTVIGCADPKPNAWVTSDVRTVVTQRFRDAGGPAYDYLTRRSWDNATVNRLLAWMTDNQATGETAAKHFLKSSPDVWTAWVSPEVADKVKAAIE